ARRAGFPDDGRALGGHLVQDPRQVRGIYGVEPRDVRAGEIELDLGGEQPDGRGDAGRRWEDRARYAERLGQPAPRDGAGAAERRERETAGVVPALNGDDAGRQLHVRRHDLVDAPGRLRDVESQRAGDVSSDAVPGGRDVEPHPAAEEVVRIEV